jgi:DNA end-binding protein Ku
MGMSDERSVTKLGFSSSRDDLAAGALEPADRSIEIWNGYLKLSLVSCPISLYPASSVAERISVRPINRKTGNHLKQQLVDRQTGQAVASENIGWSYKLEGAEYLPMEEDVIKEIQIESMHTIDMASFVQRAEVDVRDIENTYYVAPTDEVGQEAFAVIREAMRSKDMLGIGRIVLGRHERPIALGVFGRGLRAMTLRDPHEVPSGIEYFANIPDIRVPDEMHELAEHILESKATKFDPSSFEDRYELALIEMLKRAQVGMPVKPAEQPPTPSNVINLMEALRRSINQERKPSAKAERKRSARH